MAITWRGSTGTPPIVAMPNSNEIVFALVNTFRSRSKINVLRFIAMGDSVEVSSIAGHIMPLLKTWRCSATDVTGGVEIRVRPPWDTDVNSPDPGIKLFYSGFGVSESNKLQANNLVGPGWQQFIQRGITNVEQRRTLDNSMLSRMTSVEDFSILPGQAIVVSWVHGVQPVGGNIFLNIAWEEDEHDVGYTLGGNVKLSGVDVPGAKVVVVTDSDRDLPNPEVEVITTDGSGNFSKQVSSSTKASVFVQHRDGESLYTDKGKPFIQE